MKNKLLLIAMGLALTTQTLVAQVPSYVPTNGLVGYWPFNGNANDISGNGNNGTVNGATLTTDRNGNANSAYGLSTLTDNITVNNVQPEFNDNNLSVSLWMKFPLQYNQSSLALVKNGTPYVNGFDVAIDQNNSAYGVNNYQVVFLVGNGISVTFITNQAELGIWSNIVSTYDGSNIKIYLNGVLKATQLYSLGLNSPNNNLIFGSWDNPTTPAVKTRNIDDVGIWNRALTEQEITNLFNASLPQTACLPANVPTSGLVGYWPFCGNANDESGNGNNGTVNGATLTTDRFGNANSAYSFDGVDDYIISNPSNLPLNNSGRSFSFFYNYQPLQVNNNWNCVLSYGNSLGVTNAGKINDLFIGSTNSSQIYLNNNEYTTVTNTNQNFANNWHHIVVTYDGVSLQNIKIYFDGIQQSTTSQNFQNISLLASTISPLFFGKTSLSYSGVNYFYKGKLDDIGIWNRALTQQEITNLFNANQCITNITVTDTLVINVGQLSFTNPVAYANNITISPNPASTQINISFNNITNLTGGSIKVINSLGQQVATAPITATGTQTNMQLNTWGGSGLYFVQILNAQGQILDIKKIILQ